MTKKTIHIEAIDTLFFRDGKPFSMGDDVWADGIFPPLPSVIYGAMRTAYMFQNDLSVEVLEKQTEDFRITNIYLLLGNEDAKFSPAFPFPYDLVKFKNKDPMFLERIVCNTSSSDYEILQTTSQDKAENIHGKSVLESIDFKSYINASKHISVTDISQYIISEPKIGIGRNNHTRTTSGDAEGKMYRVNMQRFDMINQNKFKNMHTLKIGVEFEGLEKLDKSGIFRLGGENKVALYNEEGNQDIAIDTDKITSNIIRVYLATPAIFENGWCPEIFLQREFEKIPFKLLTCAVGKPVFSGGFDMKEQEPKYMFKAVPAGSVYYLQTDSVDNAKVLAKKLIQQNQLSDMWPKSSDISEKVSKQAQKFVKQGFGKIYVGLDKNSE